MNFLIKKQLEKCKVASIPPFDDATTKITIPKGSQLQITPYLIHKNYLVELADWLLVPSDNSTLVSNWNGGSVPKSKYYQAEITKIVGKMVRITGCGYDVVNNCSTSDVWEGWIPQSDIKLIKELI